MQAIARDHAPVYPPRVIYQKLAAACILSHIKKENFLMCKRQPMYKIRSLVDSSVLFFRLLGWRHAYFRDGLLGPPLSSDRRFGIYRVPISVNHIQNISKIPGDGWLFSEVCPDKPCTLRLLSCRINFIYNRGPTARGQKSIHISVEIFDWQVGPDRRK